MTIYLNGKCVGEIAPSSLYDLGGSSFVHLDKGIRRRLGLTEYDQSFDTLRDAYDWLMSVLPDAGVAGCQVDMRDGVCKTIHQIIG